ncbi:MAG: helix-turn-helix domain-containing protein [Treponema sp.]|jgi:transcriptional regulator with XRE-family HTH domain|nr:helix-turn-helix domain-containing protein [Treponema sp.]
MNDKLSALVGNNIKKYRKEPGISQKELAEKAGLHRAYIGGIERGERNITLDTLHILAGASNIAPVELHSGRKRCLINTVKNNISVIMNQEIFL